MHQAEWRRTLEAFNRLTREIVAAPQPIAAVDGVCVGRVRVRLRLRQPGGHPGCASVARKWRSASPFPTASRCSRRAARRLVLTGELTGAEEALRLGLVDLVVDDVEGGAAPVGADRRVGPLAVAGSKRLLDEGARNRSSTRSTASSISALASSRRRTPAKAWLRSWRNARPISAGASASYHPGDGARGRASETDAGLVAASLAGSC